MFKLVVLMYKCQHDMAPQYLQTYCERASTFSSRQLPSAHAGQLTVPRTRTNYGDRSVAVQGPWVWNSLPAELCTPDISLDMFRNKLTTFLFNAQLSMKRICCIVRSWHYRNSLIIIIIIIIIVIMACLVTEASMWPTWPKS